MNELPIIPIYFYVSTNMVRPGISGFYNNIRNRHPLHNFCRDDQPSASDSQENATP